MGLDLFGRAVRASGYEALVPGRSWVRTPARDEKVVPTPALGVLAKSAAPGMSNSGVYRRYQLTRPMGLDLFGRAVMKLWCPGGRGFEPRPGPEGEEMTVIPRIPWGAV
ncbi:hypothetical protein Bbelb_198800 [Branchiostoma belcheri]|nr:hypothetical protein Bbelb_198800 [Branchiostoma belcheri]